MFFATLFSGFALGFLVGWFRAWRVAIGVVKARLGRVDASTAPESPAPVDWSRVQNCREEIGQAIRTLRRAQYELLLLRGLDADPEAGDRLAIDEQEQIAEPQTVASKAKG